MKYDLNDVTFLLLVRLDSIERLENILAATQFLTKNFKTNIQVLECTYRDNGILKKLINRSVNYSFFEDHDPILFRTHYLNQMIRRVTTHFVSIWDADVISTKQQVIQAVEYLRNDEADFVYPYVDKLLDISEVIKNKYLKKRNLNILLKNEKWMREMYPPHPVGGAFFCNLKSYMDSGLENETFYGWGLEDAERHNRWHKLGYRIKRIEGSLYHLSHPRGINSYVHSHDQSVIKTKNAKSADCVLSKELFIKNL